MTRLKNLYVIGGILGVILLAQTFFIFYAVSKTPVQNVRIDENAGKTLSIGTGMYTKYLLPVEIVGILLLMAIVGSIILARRIKQPQLELVVDNEMKRRNEDDKAMI